MFPQEIREYNVLISDLQGTSIQIPTLSPSLFAGILYVILAILTFILGIVFVPLLFLGLFFMAFGIFTIFESFNAVLVLNAPKLNQKDRSIYIARSSAEELKLFVEEINNLQARDFNYIRRKSPSQEGNGLEYLINKR